MLLLVGLLAFAPAAHAAPGLPDFPSPDDLADAIASRMGQVFEDAINSGLNRWLSGSGSPNTTGQEVILKFLGWIIGQAMRAAAQWIQPAVRPVGENLLTQLPLAMTVGEPWVRDNYDLFARVAGAGLLGAFVIALLAAGLGNLTGFMWSEAKAVAALVVLGGALINKGYGLITWAIMQANAFASAFADPSGALPGWQAMDPNSTASGEGLGMLALVTMGFFMMIGRWINLMLVNVLIITFGLAVLCMVIPGLGSVFSHWRYLFAVGLLIQIPQAIALGQGQALVSRWGAGGSAATLAAGLGALWLAMRMRHYVPGFGGGSILGSAAQAASIARAFSSSTPTGAGPVPGQTQVNEVLGGAFGRGNPDVIYGSGPTVYRSQPLMPRPLANPIALPAPNPYRNVVDVQPLSVE